MFREVHRVRGSSEMLGASFLQEVVGQAVGSRCWGLGAAESQALHHPAAAQLLAPPRA